MPGRNSTTCISQKLVVDLISLKDNWTSAGQGPFMDDEISYHSSRALAELDLARRCVDTHAARCHLELAERHLDRMRDLARIDSASDPSTPGLA